MQEHTFCGFMGTSNFQIHIFSTIDFSDCNPSTGKQDAPAFPLTSQSTDGGKDALRSFLQLYYYDTELRMEKDNEFVLNLSTQMYFMYSTPNLEF